MRTSLFLIFLLLAFLLSGPLFAEDQPHLGRLPDGRAFRIDSEGNQLVDYIADLELSIEALNRRVYGLEDEVKEKQAIINRLENGGSRRGDLSEKDLLNNNSTSLTRNTTEKTELAQVDCNSQNEAIRSCNVSVAKLSENLKSLQSDLDLEKQVSAQRLSGKEVVINQLRLDLESRDSQLKSLQEELNSIEQRASISAEALKVEQEKTNRKVQALNQEKTKLLTIVSKSLANQHSETNLSSASLSGAKERALDIVRGRVKTEMNQLNSIVTMRDKQYAQFLKLKSKVGFKPSPLVTSNGLNLSDISKKIKSASSVHELSNLSRDIREIHAKMQDDIALMHRIGKV